MTGWADGAPPTLDNPVDYAELRSMIQRRKKEQADPHGTADSPDGLVTTTVDGRGCLLELELDDRIFQNTDAAELARTIIATARHAAANNSRRT